MCFLAVPGQNPGISSVHFVVAVVPKKQVKARQPRRYHLAVRIASGEHWPMRISCNLDGYCRRDHSRDSVRGKAARKRQHKPDWRNYVKY